MAIKFNVRKVAEGIDTEDVYIQRNLDQINLMVYLFEGLNFRTAFGMKMVDLMKLLIPRIAAARNDLLIRKLEWMEVNTAANTIVTALSSGHDLADKTLKDFFIEDYSTYTDVFGPFQKIEEAGVDLPFLHQTADQKQKAVELFDHNVPAPIVGFLNDDDHSTLPGIGNLTEYELYTKKYIDYYANLVTRNVCVVIKKAKEAGVLRGEVPGGSVKATASSKINDKACLGVECKTLTGYYCTLVEDLSGCSLDSDPWPS